MCCKTMMCIGFTWDGGGSLFCKQLIDEIGKNLIYQMAGAWGC